jgi:hypothetical protein
MCHKRLSMVAQFRRITEVIPGKKLARPHLEQQIGHGIHICNTNYAGNISRRITVQGRPRQKE